jgi:predicted RNase H-like nuclease (RuvC/YqgF family)
MSDKEQEFQQGLRDVERKFYAEKEQEEEINHLRGKVERLKERDNEQVKRVARFKRSALDSQTEIRIYKQRADQLQAELEAVKRERDELRFALSKMQSECVDVLFDFAAERDGKGLVLPMCDQSTPIADAMNTAEQLRKQGDK